MIRLDVDGKAAVVTIDRPEKRGALTFDLMAELAARVREAGASGQAALILTGNGAFCSGADLNEVMTRRELTEDRRRELISSVTQSITKALVEVPVPTLAAVDGPAIGLGLDLALACDQILVGPDGWLLQGWGRIGVVPATGGIQLLRRRSDWVLWKLLAEQVPVDGAEAERLGIGEQVATGTARTTAVQRASRLATLPSPALRAYVALSRDELRRTLPDHLRQCAQIQPSLLSDSGFEERVRRLAGFSAER